MTSPHKNKQSFLKQPVSYFIYRPLFYCIVAVIFVGDVVQTVSKFVLGLIDKIIVGCIRFPGHLLRVILGACSKALEVFKSSYTRVHRQSSDSLKKSLLYVREAVPHVSPTSKQKLHQGIEKLKFFVYGVCAASCIVLVYEGYVFVNNLPNPRLIGSVNYSVSTQIYDRNGVLLYDVFRDQDRTPVTIDSLPDEVIQATLSIEDRNFYNHNGISLVGGMLRALKDTYKTGDLQGGSTITQQLVKTSLLSPERTIDRKIKEVILAIWTERVYTKKQILEMYLNQVAYGGTSYGIEEASQTYFDISASQLNLSQAALLAGLTRAPSSYSPYVNPQLALRRRNEVLQSMYESGYISQKQLNEELEKTIEIKPPKNFIRAPHFVFYVKSLLEKKYGIRRVEEGGLRVTTSLDIRLQDEVEKILKEEVAKVGYLNVKNGAVVVTSPSTGEVLAMVGSRDYYEEPYGAFNVATARRQPGSAMKPFVYALAMEQGKVNASTPILDAPVVYKIEGSKPYVPVNYDGSFHGNVPVRFALANSYNIPAVKVMNQVGVPAFLEFVRTLGISTWDTPERYGLSLALGGAEVKLIEMAEAYGTLANYGDHVEVQPILKVEDYQKDVLETYTKEVQSGVISQATSFIISDILSDNAARSAAFGTTSDLYIPGYKVAVKTGTTNNKRDNWTHGYTRKYYVGVWVGNNDNTPMNQQLSSGVTGASPIWNKVMKLVLTTQPAVVGDIQPPSEFSLPDGVATKLCYGGSVEYFATSESASQSCNYKPKPSPNPTQTIPMVL